MKQEIDARTQYLLQNQSLIEDSISVAEVEARIEHAVAHLEWLQEEEKLRNEPKP